MTTENKETKSEENEKQALPFFELSRKVMMASVGAAILAQEEVSKFVDQLTDRGELAEKDARRLVKEVLDRREKLERERQVEAERAKANVVNRSEIDALTERIAELNKKIEEMSAKAEEKKD